MLLGEGVCSYEYMGEWEKFNETSLSEKEEFYSNLSMEDITDVDLTLNEIKNDHILNIGM